MKITYILSAVVGGVVLLAVGCGPKASPRSFSGVWEKTYAHYGQGSMEEDEIAVVTDGTKYRIENKNVIKIYDGDMMYTSLKFAKSEKDAGRLGVAQSFVRAPQEGEAEIDAFWLRNGRGVAAEGSAVIAGRSTNRYLAESVDSSGAKTTVEYWVHAKSGVVLARDTRTFDAQTGALLTKTVYQCREISRGKINDDLLVIPDNDSVAGRQRK